MVENKQNWSELLCHSLAEPFFIEQVRLKNSGIRISGSFEAPPLATLSAEDQVFIIAFVKASGSLKEMANLYGVSYPTIKSKLDKVAKKLVLTETDISEDSPASSDSPDQLLDRIESGEMSAADAVTAWQGEH